MRGCATAMFTSERRASDPASDDGGAGRIRLRRERVAAAIRRVAQSALLEVRAGRPQRRIELLMRGAGQGEERARAASSAGAARAHHGRAGLEPIAMPILEELHRATSSHSSRNGRRASSSPRPWRCSCIAGAREDVKATAAAQSLYLRICRLDPMQAMGLHAPLIHGKREIERRFRPSLLDRLTDEKPQRHPSTRRMSYAGVGARSSRRRVRRDLEWLLNTRRTPDAARRNRFERAARSSLYQLRPAGHHLHEPRLAEARSGCCGWSRTTIAHVRAATRQRARLARRSDGERHSASCASSIEGMLRLDPTPEQVMFDTVLAAFERRSTGSEGARRCVMSCCTTTSAS